VLNQPGQKMLFKHGCVIWVWWGRFLMKSVTLNMFPHTLSQFALGAGGHEVKGLYKGCAMQCLGVLGVTMSSSVPCF
jgi:hypothetical protein